MQGREKEAKKQFGFWQSVLPLKFKPSLGVSYATLSVSPPGTNFKAKAKEELHRLCPKDQKES